MGSSAKPLDGIRVLELARTLAGPWMGQILADLGADVVKLERSKVGDETRQWGPQFVKDEAGESLFSAYFHACNRGKRSLEIDFKDAHARQEIHRLVAGADIVIENFKVGTLLRYGLDAKSMLTEHPQLIWCCVTGFGQTGPFASRAAYDFVIQAASGLMSLNRDVDGAKRVPIPVADLFAGLYGAVGVLAALNRRHQTGQGTVVDISLIDTQAAAMSMHLIAHLWDGDAAMQADAHAETLPQLVVETTDGSVAVVIAGDPQFGRLCTSLNCESLLKNPSFADAPSRRKNRLALVKELTELLHGRTSADLITRLSSVGVPIARVNTVAEFFSDPQFKHQELITHLAGPPGTSALLPTVRMPVLFDGIRAIAQRSAPLLGEHNAEILTDPRWSPPPSAP